MVLAVHAVTKSKRLVFWYMHAAASAGEHLWDSRGLRSLRLMVASYYVADDAEGKPDKEKNDNETN